MDSNKKLTRYVSPTDKLLFEFDRTHAELSTTQRAEREKHLRVYALRDGIANTNNQQKKLWEDF